MSQRVNAVPTTFDGEHTCITDECVVSQVFIDNTHHELHAGKHFFIKGFTDLTGSQVLDYLFSTPAANPSVPTEDFYCHFLLNVAFEAEANIVVYEGATTSADGTPVASFCSNRCKDNTPLAGSFIAPTVTDVGVQIAALKVGSGKLTGGGARAENELVMKQGTKYLFRITNDTVSNNWFDYHVNWYEHNQGHPGYIGY